MGEDGEPERVEPANPAKPGSDKPSTPRRPRLSRSRRVIAWVLVVLAALLIPLSVVTAWAVDTVTKTDQYVATMAPLVREKVITNYVATQATNKLFDSVDVQGRIEKALPKRAHFLAAPITFRVYTFVRDQIDKILNSEWFHKLWDRLNERSHSSVVNVLTGKVTPGQRAHRVLVDVTPVITKAIDTLDSKGVTVFDPVRQRLRQADTLTVKIATAKQISKARHAFSVITSLGWLVPVFAAIVVVAGVAVAVDRRKTLLRMSVGTAIFAVVLLGSLALGRSFFIDHATRVTPPVTGAIFDILLRFLKDWLRITIAIAIVLAIALWLAGPGRWPRWLRAKVALAARWCGRRVAELNSKEHRAQTSSAARTGARWVMEHRDGLRLAGVIVAGAIIVLGGNLSVDGVFWTGVALVLYLIVLALVVAWARRTSEAAGDASTPDGGASGGEPARVGAPSGEAAAGTRSPERTGEDGGSGSAPGDH
jgi:hypothetical protein